MIEPKELIEELTSYYAEWLEQLPTNEDKYKLLLNILAQKSIKLKAFNEYLLAERKIRDGEIAKARHINLA